MKQVRDVAVGRRNSTTLEFMLKPRARGRAKGPFADAAAPADSDRIPRITRLMALAIKFDGLIREGTVRDYADLARLGFVTRARITQIMSLLNLAPDIQEDILSLRIPAGGKDSWPERNLRDLTAATLWSRQRAMWRARSTGASKA